MDNTASHPILGVSVALLAGGRFLLVERGQPPFAGLLSLPGGKVAFGERLEAAAHRELREETGVVVESLTFLRLHEAIDETLHAVIAVFCGPTPDDLSMQAGDDAAALHLLTLQEIVAADAAGRTTPGLSDVAKAVPEHLAASRRMGPGDGIPAIRAPSRESMGL